MVVMGLLSNSATKRLITVAYGGMYGQPLNRLSFSVVQKVTPLKG